MKVFNVFFSDVKEFLNNEVNRILIVVVLILLALCFCQYRTETQLNELRKQVNKQEQILVQEVKENRDKIHFRYFNITTSLEAIHGVKINTKNGKLEK